MFLFQHPVSYDDKEMTLNWHKTNPVTVSGSIQIPSYTLAHHRWYSAVEEFTTGERLRFLYLYINNNNHNHHHHYNLEKNKIPPPFLIHELLSRVADVCAFHKKKQQITLGVSSWLSKLYHAVKTYDEISALA